MPKTIFEQLKGRAARTQKAQTAAARAPQDWNRFRKSGWKLQWALSARANCKGLYPPSVNCRPDRRNCRIEGCAVGDIPAKRHPTRVEPPLLKDSADEVNHDRDRFVAHQCGTPLHGYAERVGEVSLNRL